MANKKEGSVGEAYGFFHYAGKREDAHKGFRRAVELASPAEGLESYLYENLNDINTPGNPELAKIVKMAKRSRHGLNYAVKVRLPGAENEEAARELGDIFQGIYGILFPGEEEFFSEIVYKSGNKYVSFL